MIHRVILGLANSTEHVNRQIYDTEAKDSFRPALVAILDKMGAFEREYGPTLPADAAGLLSQLLEQREAYLCRPQTLNGVILLSTWISMLCARIEPLLLDRDARHVHIAERAFLHLQRLLVVDREVSRAWKVAFKEGETACERLGGCHLLHHGIYGVKANSKGERTDLILGTSLAVVPATLRRAADAMAVTEWKLVRDKSQLNEMSDNGRGQLERYVEGSLAGFEIAKTRFVVIVSKDIFPVRDDETTGRITYRYINIAVEPASPSKAPRSRLRRSQARS